MIIRINLNPEEAAQWDQPGGRQALLDRYREIAERDDVDRIEVWAGMLQLVELAPGTHERFAARLRDLDLHLLADLVDPSKNPDEVARAKYAQQMTRLGEHYQEKIADQSRYVPEDRK